MSASTWSSSSAIILLTVLANYPAAADDGLSRSELQKRGLAATAFVETKGGGGFGPFNQQGGGSAFCIEPHGLFLTNEHVVHPPGQFPGQQRQPALKEVTLVLNPGDKTEKSYAARVIRTDPDLDLALLRIDGVENLPVLPLGSDENLEVLMDVVFFGFPYGSDLPQGPGGPPFGRPGQQARKEYQSATGGFGTISQLRRKEKGLDRIQLDGTINPGNSGGPVLDKNGKVIGVVASQVVAERLGRTGINYAIPVSHVARFLTRPDIQFDPPRIDAANIYQPVKFEARVTPLIPTKTPLSVALTLKPGKGNGETYPMQADGIRYSVSARPLTPPATETFRLLAQFDNGLLNATTTDQTFKVGDKEVQLHEVRAIMLRRAPQVLLTSGKKVEGVVSGLNAVPVRLGDQSLAIDLSKASEVKFAPGAETDLIRYTLVVRQGDKEVLNESDNLFIQGLLPTPVVSAQPNGIKVPNLEGDKVIRKLSSRASDVAVGGGGRYLVLRLPKEHQLVIFDADGAEFTGHIPIPEDGALFAAGLEDVVVLLPAAGTIERWSLKTFEREAFGPLPIKQEIKVVSMGSASKGPMLVHWTGGDRGTPAATGVSFINLETLKLLGTETKIDGQLQGNLLGPFNQSPVHLRASANGKVFGMWGTNRFPSGVGVIIFSDVGCQSYYMHNSAGYVVPSPDGKLLFTRSGMFAPEVNLIGNFPSSEPVLPACHGDQYLMFPLPAGSGRMGPHDLVRKGEERQEKPGRGGQPAPGANRPRPEPPASGADNPTTLRALGRDTPLGPLPDLELVVPNEDTSSNDFTFDKRVHLIPDARLIITIPTSNDRLVLYRIGMGGK